MPIVVVAGEYDTAGLDVPKSRALLRSLAKEESHLAERLCESVLCRHYEAN